MVYSLGNWLSLDLVEEVRKEGPCEVEDNYETFASGEPCEFWGSKRERQEKASLN